MNINIINYVAAIDDELERLGVDTSADPCSGLMVGIVEDAPGIVTLYEDNARGEYRPSLLLGLLQRLKPGEVTLEPDSETAQNIWVAIASAEA